VIQADGGTRTASITEASRDGARAQEDAIGRSIKTPPIIDHVAAQASRRQGTLFDPRMTKTPAPTST
jgi:ribonuclease PH